MAKDLRATRDQMRDKRAGTLDGRKWSDYKNGGSNTGTMTMKDGIKALEALKLQRPGKRGYGKDLNKNIDNAIRVINRISEGKPVSILSPVADFKMMFTELNEDNFKRDMADWADFYKAHPQIAAEESQMRAEIEWKRDIVRRANTAIRILQSLGM